jgi:hypothetical protein
MIGPPVLLGEATSHDELISVMIVRKAQLGLSNEFIDNTIPLSDGHTDKILGPSRERGLSQLTLDAMLSVLALKLIVVEDARQAARMKSRWSGRDCRMLRPPARIGAALIKRARPAVLRAAAAAAAKARWSGTTPELRRLVMRSVWMARRNVRAHQSDCAAAETPDGAP